MKPEGKWSSDIASSLKPVSLLREKRKILNLIPPAAWSTELGKRSPYFAWRGGQLCYVASSAAKFPGREMPRLNEVIRENGFFLAKDAPELFRWALLKMPPILEAKKQGGRTLDPVPLFSGSPLIELEALQTVEKKEVKGGK